MTQEDYKAVQVMPLDASDSTTSSNTNTSNNNTHHSSSRQIGR